MSTFISLFCGVGGLDAGFIQAGYRCVGAFDIDATAVAVHNHNLGVTAHRADLTKVSADAIRPKTPPDVVIAGSPCQGFSTIGTRNLRDPRNALLLTGARIALALQPRLFIAENVSGVLKGDHREYWQKLEKMTRQAGYSTQTIVLEASDVGLAQRRSRVFFVARRTGRAPMLEPKSPGKIALKDALEGVDRASDHDEVELPKASAAHVIALRIAQGQRLTNVRGGASSVHTWDIPEVYGRTTEQERQILLSTMSLRRSERVRTFGDADPVAISSLTRDCGKTAISLIKLLVDKGFMKHVGEKVDLTNTFNGHYKRLSWASQGLTVDTKFGEPRFFLHPIRQRGFTVREAARIQGFADEFTFPVPRRTAYRLIGNAVPPPMAKFIAEAIREIL